MDGKVDVRYRARARRKALDEATRVEFSERICERALDLIADCGGPVFCYLSMGSEVDTHKIISRLIASGRTVCVPRVEGDGMVAVGIEAGTSLEKGAMGIYEPTEGDVIRPDDIGVVIAPLIAFDSLGNRLGQGGGYYDKFMTSQAFRVGVAFSCQEDEFPVEAHDVALDAVVTEEGVRVFNENYRR